MYIKKIFNQSLLYGIGNTFSSVFGLLIVPVYTRLLSVQNFGRLSLILTAIFLFQYAYTVGIYGGFVVRYFDFKTEDFTSRKRLCSTILFFYLFFCLFTSLFVYLFLGPTLGYFVGTEDRLVILFIVLISSCEILYGLPTLIMRLEEKVTRFIWISLTKSFVLLIVIFIALKFISSEINTALAAQLAVTGCITIFSFLVTSRHYGLIFDINELKKSVKIGLPLLIVMLSFWLIDSANKFMIKHFLSLTDVALYSVGFKIGQLIIFFVTVFQLVWQPTMFKIATEENAPEIFRKTFNYFTFIIFIIALVISLFARELILIFSTNTYVASSGVAQIIVFAYLFFGIFYFLETPLIIKKHFYRLMIISASGAIFNIIANFVSIPLFGIKGAAYTTAITYFVVAYTVLLVSQKIYYIPYDLSKLFKISYTFVFILAIEQIKGHAYLLLDVLFKIALMFLFFFILILIGFFDKKEKSFLKEKFRLFINYGNKIYYLRYKREV